MSTNVSTISDAGKPYDGVFQLVTQVPGQDKKSRPSRQRRARPKRSNVEQLALPDLLPSGEENQQRPTRSRISHHRRLEPWPTPAHPINAPGTVSANETTLKIP